MRKRVFVFAFVTLVLTNGCTNRVAEIRVSLGQEFLLAIGQSVVIEGENLGIRFEKVIEDSRCPRNVVCVWEGRVSSLVRITSEGSSYDMVLTQPGLTDEPSKETYQKYRFDYRVEPYPVAGKEIAEEEYRLFLTVNRR